MDQEELRKCKETWLQTLARFGINRHLMMSEETEIARAIQKHGAEAVELALFGAGFEPVTERFDPRAFVRISRVLKPDAKGEERIDRFVNLGARERSRQEGVRRGQEEMEKRRKEIEETTVPHQEGALPPDHEEKVKAFLTDIRAKLRVMPK